MISDWHTTQSRQRIADMSSIDFLSIDGDIYAAHVLHFMEDIFVKGPANRNLSFPSQSILKQLHRTFHPEDRYVSNYWTYNEFAYGRPYSHQDDHFSLIHLAAYRGYSFYVISTLDNMASTWMDPLNLLLSCVCGSNPQSELVTGLLTRGYSLETAVMHKILNGEVSDRELIPHVTHSVWITCLANFVRLLERDSKSLLVIVNQHIMLAILEWGADPEIIITRYITKKEERVAVSTERYDSHASPGREKKSSLA